MGAPQQPAGAMLWSLGAWLIGVLWCLGLGIGLWSLGAWLIGGLALQAGRPGMGTEQCAVVISVLKLKLWLKTFPSRAEKQRR